MTEECGLTPAELLATYGNERDPIAVIANDLRAAWRGEEAVDEAEANIWAEALWCDAREWAERATA